jgi:hypothetical protein
MGTNAPVAAAFERAGWKVKALGTYWQLAVAPGTDRAPVCRGG